MKLNKEKTTKIIRAALKEDIGSGDITTVNAIPKLENIKGAVVANDDCVLCGINIAEWTVCALGPGVKFKPKAKDGERVCKGKEIAFLEGRARAILQAERTMLNFLSFLSGITTKVNSFAELAGKYGVKIYDTRKTFPLLRYLEKYAVETGGGFNHRFGLWDQALVKENHLKAISCKLSAISPLLKNIRGKINKRIKIEIEVTNLKEFKEALKGKPDIIMLDNMQPKEIRKAVEMRNAIAGRKPILEVSGGITLSNLEAYAKTGVDRISAGSLTNSVSSIDMSLDIVA